MDLDLEGGELEVKALADISGGREEEPSMPARRRLGDDARNALLLLFVIALVLALGLVAERWGASPPTAVGEVTPTPGPAEGAGELEGRLDRGLAELDGGLGAAESRLG